MLSFVNYDIFLMNFKNQIMTESFGIKNIFIACMLYTNHNKPNLDFFPIKIIFPFFVDFLDDSMHYMA